VDLTYDVKWCPRNATTFASASGDGTAHIHDARLTSAAAGAQQRLVHGTDVLCCDFTAEADLVTGSVDGLIRVWDLRKPSHPLRRLSGHGQAVRRVRALNRGRIISCSYDFTTR
jgi:WD40 repeat protein